MDKSAKGFIYDNMLAMSAYWACSGTIVAGLTSYFNIPVALSSIVTGLTSTLPLLQLFGGMGYTRSKNKHVFLLIFNALWRVVLPLAFFAVLLPHNIGGAVMIASIVLGIGIFQFACPSQTDWMVSHVEGRVKSDYYSIRETVFMLVYTVVFAAVSLSIDTATRAGNAKYGFLTVGIIEIVLLSASLIILFRLPKPVIHSEQHIAKLSFREPFANKRFRGVMLAYMVFSFANMFIASFAAMYQIRIMKLDFLYVMIFSTAANIVRALITPFMARLASKTTWRRTTAMCIGITLLNGVLWYFTNTDNVRVLFPLLALLAAIPCAGMGVGFLKMQVDSSPSENRSTYFSVNSTMNGAAAFTGSILCSVVINIIETISGNEDNLRYVFVVGIVITAAAMLITLRADTDVK